MVGTVMERSVQDEVDIRGRHSRRATAMMQTDLRLSESQRGGQLRSFRQRQVLSTLESPVELLQLKTRVDRPRFAHFLATCRRGHAVSYADI